MGSGINEVKDPKVPQREMRRYGQDVKVCIKVSNREVPQRKKRWYGQDVKVCIKVSEREVPQRKRFLMNKEEVRI